MNVGLLKPGEPADLIITTDLTHFHIKETYIHGVKVAAEGKSLVKTEKSGVINKFDCKEVKPEDLHVPFKGQKEIHVIEALDGQLITNSLLMKPTVHEGRIEADAEKDILKIVVVNRYMQAPISKGFIKNMGLKTGALASSVAHDSHNIVAAGTDDESICRAINLVIREQGGISAVGKGKEMILGLPVAGLMTNNDGYEVSRLYTAMDRFAKEELGSSLGSPYMTLSFMALLVIPYLKLSDKGLFDGGKFCFIEE
jgi:adenine deaminase